MLFIDLPVLLKFYLDLFRDSSSSVGIFSNWKLFFSRGFANIYSIIYISVKSVSLASREFTEVILIKVVMIVSAAQFSFPLGLFPSRKAGFSLIKSEGKKYIFKLNIMIRHSSSNRQFESYFQRSSNIHRDRALCRCKHMTRRLNPTLVIQLPKSAAPWIFESTSQRSHNPSSLSCCAKFSHCIT